MLFSTGIAPGSAPGTATPGDLSANNTSQSTVAVGTCPVIANRLYVDATALTGGNGSSWSCAVKELSTAISMVNAAPAITSIWVADGTYKPTNNTDRSVLMQISRSNLTILGGFSGNETMASQANPVANPTIISGDIGVANNTSDNSRNLLAIFDLAASANPLVIDGFTVSDGNGGNVGAAVVAYNNAPSTMISFRRCNFLNNTALTDGGAFYNILAPMTFDSCRFAGNTAGGVGGAMYTVLSNFTFNDCVFANNTAPQGGAVYGNEGMPIFNRTVFSGNSATYGGAVYQNRMNTNYNNCVFNANSASMQGGGIYAHNLSMANIANTTFFRNTSVSTGAALFLGLGASTTTANSIFWRNAVNGVETAPTGVVMNATNGANVYANNMLQQNTTVPADNGGTTRDNLRGINPLFTNEASAIGADMMWATADDGLQLTDPSRAKNNGDNALAPAGTDIRKNNRIVCGTVDNGAYENQGGCGGVAELEDFVTSGKTNNITGVVANPFSNDLQIQYMGKDKAAITVASASGKVMFTASNIKQGVTHVNASTWSSGLYEVVIIDATGKRVNFKVVKL